MSHLVSERTGEVVTVPSGESVVGRGLLLKVIDKRVSRNHALLHHENGKLQLCPKHRNPCFYKPAGRDTFSVLDKDVWQELSHGDCFSLLPDECIFQVVSDGEKTNKTATGTTLTASTMPSSGLPDEPMDIEPDKAQSFEPSHKAKPSTAVAHETEVVPQSSVLTETPVLEPAVPTQTVPDSIDIPAAGEAPTSSKKSLSGRENSAGSTGKARSLPPWLRGLTATSKPPPKKRRPPVAVKASLKSANDEHSPPTKVAKRDDVGATAEPSTGKRKGEVKYSERGEDMRGRARASAKTTDTETKPATARETGDRSEEGATKEEKKETKDDKKLPLCPYGISCYRKNPLHFREYSHDFSTATGGDSEDSGAEDSEKPLCPYGAKCYRKNPAHRKEYRHTGPPAAFLEATGTRRSTRKRRGKPKRSVLADESDDDDLPNTYDYNDSFIDDEDVSEESSYGSDSEDSDWAPDEGRPKTGGDDDSEDVADLVADAEEFLKNKKMTRPV